MNRALVVVMLAALAGCASTQASAQRYALSSEEPGKVPAQMELVAGQERVVVLTLGATKEGYAVERTVIVMGTPTRAVGADRDVVVTAREASGQVVSRVSVLNPRELHTTGSKKPETAILEKGTFTVALPRPESIATIDVEVRRGPNAPSRHSFKPAVDGTARPDGSRLLFVPR